MSMSRSGGHSSSFRIHMLGILPALAVTIGCGSSATSGSGDTKADSELLKAAQESLSTPTKVRGKTVPAASNLSVKERRALKQAGELPK